MSGKRGGDLAPDARDLVVLKFGGTSVAAPENWQTIHGILMDRIEAGLRPVVVCSALAGVSNQLERLLENIRNGTSTREVVDTIQDAHERLAKQLGLRNQSGVQLRLKELSALVQSQTSGGEIESRMRAEIVAQGELLSSTLGNAWLNEQGLSSQWQDARGWLQAHTPGSSNSPQEYLSATCSYDEDPRTQGELRARNGVIVTQGFIARNQKKHTVLLGRGGSDTAASYLAAKLGAKRVEIWTDVPGVFTANPRQITEARLINHLSYDEAEVFAAHGAKVLHPRCLQPLRKSGIPLGIHWIERPQTQGTRIDNVVQSPGVKGVSVRNGLYLLNMERESTWQPVGFMADVASCFKECGLSIDLVSTSPNRILATLDPSASPGAEERIRNLVRLLQGICRPSVQTGVASVSTLR